MISSRWDSRLNNISQICMQNDSHELATLHGKSALSPGNAWNGVIMLIFLHHYSLCFAILFHFTTFEKQLVISLYDGQKLNEKC